MSQPGDQFQMRLLGSAVEAGDDAVLITEGPGPTLQPSRLLYANPAARQLLGDPARLRPEAWSARPENAAALAHLRAQTAALKTCRAELRADLPGGERWIEVLLVPLQDGGEALWLTVAKDISDRKRIEAALEARNRELNQERDFIHTVIAHVPIAIASLDPALRYRWVNPAYAEALSLPPEAFPGRQLGERVPHVKAQLGPQLEQALATGTAFAVSELAGTRGRHWDLRVTPLFTPEHQVDGLLLLCQDVSARVEQRRLQQARYQKLEELDRLKDHILSGLSHELKTPLSLILGYGELLEEKYPQEPLIGGVLEGGRRLIDQLSHVVDYAAMLAGSLPLYWTPVGLDEIVAHACAIMLPRFQELGVALENAVGPDAPVVSGDARRLTQVLTELLDNARKLTPAGGRVGVRACLEGGMARLEVWDTGPGIPEAQQQAIWEPFTQLETGDRQRKGGLGLGLAIVRKLTELHGGRVGLDSAPGRGSTFSISLPVAAP